MTHLGQRLSALIDGELDMSERERVLVHMTKCAACRDEVAALRMLKRRMNALGDAAAGAALTGLTGRLLDELGRMAWPGGLPEHDGWPATAHGSLDQAVPDRQSVRGSSTARYFLAGSLAVMLAGLGTAAFVGGESSPQAPSPPAAPSVDVFVVPHEPAEPGPAPSGFRSAPQVFPATRGRK